LLQLGLLGAERRLLGGRGRGPELPDGLAEPIAQIDDAIVH
jgi:hypothetical protein